jgi:hypothetical protein
LSGTRCCRGRRDHAQRLQIGVEDRFLLQALVRVLLADRDDLAQDLRIEARGLGLAIDILDVVRNGLLLFFQPFDPFDESAKLIACEALSIRHGLLLWGMNFRVL